MRRALVVGCVCAIMASSAFAVKVTVGGYKARNMGLPFGPSWRGRLCEVFCQSLVLAEDGVPAGMIEKWEWGVPNWKGDPYEEGEIYGFSLRCCHTPLTALTILPIYNYCGNVPVTVYGPKTAYLKRYIDWGDGMHWVGFAFDKPFYYDGQNNLIVEIIWYWIPKAEVNVYHIEAKGRFVTYYKYYVTETGPWGRKGWTGATSLEDVFHLQKITINPGAGFGGGITPTSLGRVKSMYR